MTAAPLTAVTSGLRLTGKRNKIAPLKRCGRMASVFSSEAAFEGLPEADRGVCMPQTAEKTAPDAPLNCAALHK